jgi:antitoxin CcdA
MRMAATSASPKRRTSVARDRPARTVRPVRASPERARKTATNLSLPADLVRRAKELKLNLSQLVERTLARAIREAEQARWLAENEQAIEQYNAFVEKHGVFSDDHRLF